MKRVLVTGGQGFIASHVIEQLNNRGIEVVTNVRSGNVPTYLTNAEVYPIDSRDAVGMYSIIEKVDGVINLAGILGTKHIDNPWKFYENNVKSVINIIAACKEFDIPLVQISVGNHFEHNNYSNTKVAAEREVLKSVKYEGLKGHVVRGLNAYGERQKVKNTGKIIPTFVTKALNNEPIQVYGGKDNCSDMDMVYVKDLAYILVDTLLNRTDYTVVKEAGTGKAPSVYEIAKEIIKLSNSESTIEEVPMRSGESKKSKVIANNPVEYNYTPLEEGLIKTIKWYDENRSFWE